MLNGYNSSISTADKKKSSLDKDYEYISHTTLMRNYRSVSKGKEFKTSASFTSIASIGTVDENNYEIYPYAMFGWVLKTTVQWFKPCIWLLYIQRPRQQWPTLFSKRPPVIKYDNTVGYFLMSGKLFSWFKPIIPSEIEPFYVSLNPI